MPSAQLNDYIAFFVPQSTDGELYDFVSSSALFAHNDDEGRSAQIAFPASWSGFPFGTGSYSHFHVDINGWVGLASAAGESTHNAGYANTALDTGTNFVLLCPWWDDLRTHPTNGYVKYELQTGSGYDPERVVVEWYNVAYYNHTAANGSYLKYQCVMKQGGNIEFRYAASSSAGAGVVGTSWGSATVGVKAVTITPEPGIDGNIRSFGWFLKNSASHSRPNNPAGSTVTVAEYLKVQDHASYKNWPGNPENNSPTAEAFNIHFIRDPSAYPTFGEQTTEPYPEAEGSFVINVHKNLPAQYNIGGGALIGSAAEQSGSLSPTSGPNVPHALSIKGPISLRSRGKAYSISNGGDPDQTTN